MCPPELGLAPCQHCRRAGSFFSTVSPINVLPAIECSKKHWEIINTSFMVCLLCEMPVLGGNARASSLCAWTAQLTPGEPQAKHKGLRSTFSRCPAPVPCSCSPLQPCVTQCQVSSLVRHPAFHRPAAPAKAFSPLLDAPLLCGMPLAKTPTLQQVSAGTGQRAEQVVHGLGLRLF